MKKSKRGFTLIELMVGMLVLIAALLAGSQIFTAAGYGYSNSVRLANAADTLASVFDTAPATMPDKVTHSSGNANIKFNLGGVEYTDTTTLITLLYNDNNVKAQLFGLKNSYGNGK